MTETRTTTNARTAELDDYDQRALEGLSPNESLSVSQLHRRYQSAGVLQKGKIKRRLKRLDRLGVIERDGMRWVLAGGVDR